MTGLYPHVRWIAIDILHPSSELEHDIRDVFAHNTRTTTIIKEEPIVSEVFEAKETIDQWDTAYYHPISLKLYDWAVADMLRLMEVEPGATVLDGGCGPGVHSIRVAKAGHPVVGIDISSSMLAQARQRAEAAGVADKIEFHQKDLTALELPDAAYRYVFSWGVVIHIPTIEKALDELARVVEPGGMLALYLTNKHAFDQSVERFARFVLRKPLKGLQHLPMGDGVWYEMSGDRLWVWKLDAAAVTAHLAKLGFTLKHRRIGELSEIQTRLRGFPRRMLLHLNNLAYRMNLPPGIGATNLYVFEKTTG